MKKFDLTWGESICTRSAFLETLSGRPIIFGLRELDNFGYSKHEGNPELVELTKKVIKRVTGNEYKYVFLTNGATGGVTIAMRAYVKHGYNVVFTPFKPFFALYPSMVSSAGMKRIVGATVEPGDNPIALVDSPNNPTGQIAPKERTWSNPIIWDAVYHTPVYAPLAHSIQHDVLVGSYSKLTGLNGIRVGWIATNDDSLKLILADLVTAEYAGLSTANTNILMEYLGNPEYPFYWDSFEHNARYKLDFNRGEWSKLEKYFGNYPVSQNGMFYYAPMDQSCKKLIEKAGIQWMSGSLIGGDDSMGRFNIGQDNKLVLNAVKAVLKADKIK